MTPGQPVPDKFGIFLRVALFVVIGYISMVIFPIVMLPLAGLLVTSVLSVFAAAALANAITVRVYERGRLSDLGLGWTETSLREFLYGIAAAAGAAAVILAGSVLAGAATFESAPSVEHRWSSILFLSIVLLFGAAGEEMLFHGYAFQLLIRSLGAFATILPASILFGLAHLSNEHATVPGILNTIAWGILLGYAYLRTNALWLPIGLHYGWNIALPLFGVNLSGFTMGVTGYAMRWRTADLWSGGAYGPEGSVLTTAAVVALFFVVNRVIPGVDRQ